MHDEGSQQVSQSCASPAVKKAKRRSAEEEAATHLAGPGHGLLLRSARKKTPFLNALHQTRRADGGGGNGFPPAGATDPALVRFLIGTARGGIGLLLAHCGAVGGGLVVVEVQSPAAVYVVRLVLVADVRLPRTARSCPLARRELSRSR